MVSSTLCPASLATVALGSKIDREEHPQKLASYNHDVYYMKCPQADTRVNTGEITHMGKCNAYTPCKIIL